MDELTKQLVMRRVENPDNWLMGTMPSGPKQLIPNTRDAAEIIKRLQGGLSRVPTGAKTLLQGDFYQFPAKGRAWMEKEFSMNNPIFQRMQAQGLFRK